MMGVYVLLIGLILPLSAVANRLATLGHTHRIVEPDFLMVIHQRLQTLQATGALSRIRQQMIQRIKAHVLRPTAVPGITDLTPIDPIQRHRFDPSITLSHDVWLPDGRRLARAGTQINPLKTVSLNERLLFINGDDVRQRDWAKRWLIQSHKLHQRIKLILVRGNIDITAKALQQTTYFDQWGRLTARFGIHHMPAMVIQANVPAHQSPYLWVKEGYVAVS